MLQPHEIKLEQQEGSSKKRKHGRRSSPQLPECTCPSEVLDYSESSEKSKKYRQVLVNFGLKRKKIFTLKSKKDSLHQMFTSFVSGDPAFSKLLDNAYVVFQEYNSKFGTYVDVDHSKNLRDGSVVKAVFFPTRLERDDGNPGYIKTTEKNNVQNSSSDLIQINSSDSDDDDEVSTVACEVSTTKVDVSPLQTTSKKRKKKRKEKHSQESQNSLETSVESEQIVGDPSEVQIKLEDISVNQLLMAKSCAASTSVVSDSPNKQVESPIQNTHPELERNHSSSHPAVTTENKQPLPSESHLDYAVSQNKNQKQSNHLRYTSPKTGPQKVNNIVKDYITRLSEACKEEVCDEPTYAHFTHRQTHRCKVTVKGFTFCGHGCTSQLAKQNAASLALEFMGYCASERAVEGERRKSYQNEGRYNGIKAQEEMRKKMIGEENGGIQGREEEYRKEETGGSHRKEETGGSHRKEETGGSHRKEKNGGRERKDSGKEKNGVRDTEESSTREGAGRGGGRKRESWKRGRGSGSNRGRSGHYGGGSGWYGGGSASYGGGSGSYGQSYGGGSGSYRGVRGRSNPGSRGGKIQCSIQSLIPSQSRGVYYY